MSGEALGMHRQLATSDAAPGMPRRTTVPSAVPESPGTPRRVAPEECAVGDVDDNSNVSQGLPGTPDDDDAAAWYTAAADGGSDDDVGPSGVPRRWPKSADPLPVHSSCLDEAAKRRRRSFRIYTGSRLVASTASPVWREPVLTRNGKNRGNIALETVSGGGRYLGGLLVLSFIFGSWRRRGGRIPLHVRGQR